MRLISLQMQKFFDKEYIDKLHTIVTNGNLSNQYTLLGISDPFDMLYTSNGLPSWIIQQTAVIMFHDPVEDMYFVVKNRHTNKTGWFYSDDVRKLIDLEMGFMEKVVF